MWLGYFQCEDKVHVCITACVQFSKPLNTVGHWSFHASLSPEASYSLSGSYHCLKYVVSQYSSISSSRFNNSHLPDHQRPFHSRTLLCVCSGGSHEWCSLTPLTLIKNPASSASSKRKRKEDPAQIEYVFALAKARRILTLIYSVACFFNLQHSGMWKIKSKMWLCKGAEPALCRASVPLNVQSLICFPWPDSAMNMKDRQNQ